MNRTQRLMASVAAAMALFGSTAAQAAGGSNIQDRGAQAPGTDSVPTQAADAVYEKVDGVRSKAVSLDDLQKRLHKIDRRTIEAALNRLVDEGKIRQIGDGTPDDPYRYYRYSGGGG